MPKQSFGVNELRRMFLDYFVEQNDHLSMKSFSLVPKNDNSLLLINAGMAPLKPYFTGQEIPPKRRVTTCQKCIRTGDIDNVGKTARHLTFFEMLGNFSFGDYFKHEAIHWSWEFLTEYVGLEPDRLYPSVYGEDDEAFEIWNKEIGIPANRISRFYRDENGECDNFWEHGAGPCGPCSEIYYDRGPEYGEAITKSGEDGDFLVGYDGDRYMEVWNNVFTQFENDGHGNYTTLSQKNIDTGMGLERLAVVVQNVNSVFDIDTMRAIRDRICEIAGVEYGVDHKTDVAVRIITDHMRSVTFMISDGIKPSNVGRGYVLRRLLRRAARQGRLLGIPGAFLTEIAKTVIETSADGYPELAEKQDYILTIISVEEERFGKTIDQGLAILAEMEDAMSAAGEHVLSGENAFKLYDTYGFPLDLTKDVLEEKGFSIDEEGFAAYMKEQQVRAKAARKTTNYMGADATIYDEIDVTITSKFVGYDHLTWDSKISVLTTEDEIVDEVAEGMDGVTIIVDETPFYATMGGQVADTGIITCGEAKFAVRDTIQLKGGRVGHVGEVLSGNFSVGDVVTLSVDAGKRAETANNHSATHLLQEALRQVLGTHVEQAGSLVNCERLRFDFTHFAAMTDEEIARVEAIVNEKIREQIPVETLVLSLEEAQKTGAKALFGEKYGDVVRVVCMGEFSKEFCGGTHVKNTGDIRLFKILSESGVAAGVRRIEAVTDAGVMAYYAAVEKELAEAAKAAKTNAENLPARIQALTEEVRALSSENEKLKQKLANQSMGDVMDQVVEVKGVKVLAANVPEADMNALRTLGDDLKVKLGEGVIFLASAKDGKVSLLCMATDGAMAKGVHAGNLVKKIAPIVGGGGGGRPNMAQAGGKNPAAVDEALAAVAGAVEEQI